MYFDLNVPISIAQVASSQPPKKSKGKQPQSETRQPTYTPAQLISVENRIDLLVHLGYNAIAFNQVVHKKIDPKTFVNGIDPLLEQLRKRSGIIYLKRLTIVLDEDSEKGFGLTNANLSLVQPYDILALLPTTQSTFSTACITHTLPSPLTTHIISLPLTVPRLPFHLKHTLVRNAIKNGACFEINYAGALGGGVDMEGGETGTSAKRNWWAAARELCRVTKGKGIILSGGADNDADVRAPRDVGNLITLLGLAQNQAHDASTTTPKSLVLRAQTRKTYRAVLSEPRLVVPPSNVVGIGASSTSTADNAKVLNSNTNKRSRESDAVDTPTPSSAQVASQPDEGAPRKKKKKKSKP